MWSARSKSIQLLLFRISFRLLCSRKLQGVVFLKYRGTSATALAVVACMPSGSLCSGKVSENLKNLKTSFGVLRRLLSHPPLIRTHVCPPILPLEFGPLLPGQQGAREPSCLTVQKDVLLHRANKGIESGPHSRNWAPYSRFARSMVELKLRCRTCSRTCMIQWICGLERRPGSYRIGSSCRRRSLRLVGDFVW